MKRKQTNVSRKVISSTLALVMALGGAALPGISSKFSLSNDISASADYSTRYGTLSYVLKGDNTAKITSCGLKNATVDGWYINRVALIQERNTTYYFVSEVGFQAFKDTQYMSHVYFGSSVKTLDSEAFACCPNLSLIENGDIECGLETIGYRAFYNCPKLNEVTLPNSVSRIDSQAFGYNADGTKVSGFTFICREGTTAETAAKNYAQENGFSVCVQDNQGNTKAVYNY